MKKFIGITIAIMMLMITIPFVRTSTVGVPSHADVSESATEILDAWFVISNSSNELWNSSILGGPRSDSYIYGGEILEVFVIIRDYNGINTSHNPPTHSLSANLTPNNYHPSEFTLGPLIFNRYMGAGESIALFNLTFTMVNPAVLRCLHYIFIVINGVNYILHNLDFDPPLYDKIYINPYASPIFSNTSVSWSDLNPGDTDIESDGNPFNHTVHAFCNDTIDDEEIIYNVTVDYNLYINGSDMIQVGAQYPDIIPIENISFYTLGSSITSLSEIPYLIDHFKANNPQQFDFFIDVPNVISAGSYNGEINFIVETY